jgi:transposase
MTLVRTPTSGAGEREAGPAVRRRRRYSIAEKRRLVAEALRPGASVSAIARGRNINTNLLFNWCRQAQRGLLPAAPASDGPPAFVPVGVIGGSASPIEIELRDGTRLRVGTPVDAAALRQVLQILKEAR